MPKLNEPENLPEEFFDREFNEGLIHQVVVSHEANKRANLAQVKDRSQVSGRNKKPWRQKGTGRSRHGSRISPLWVGGGQANAPDGNQDHSKNLTKKMKYNALSSAISVRRKEGHIYVIDNIDLDNPDTSSFDDFFEEEGLVESNLLLVHTSDENNLRLSTRNLTYCEPTEVSSLNTYHVVSHDRIVFTEDALDAFLERVND